MNKFCHNPAAFSRRSLRITGTYYSSSTQTVLQKNAVLPKYYRFKFSRDGAYTRRAENSRLSDWRKRTTSWLESVSALIVRMSLLAADTERYHASAIHCCRKKNHTAYTLTKRRHFCTQSTQYIKSPLRLLKWLMTLSFINDRNKIIKSV